MSIDVPATTPAPADGGGASVHLAAVEDLAERVVAAARATRIAAERRDDLTHLARADRDDARFRAGLAWGIAALDRVAAALAGEADPARLTLRALSPPR